MVQYFSHSVIPSQCKVFCSVVVIGRYKGIPHEAKYCRCHCKERDTVRHFLLYCLLFTHLHLYLMNPLFQMSKTVIIRGIDHLLADKLPKLTEQVTEFLANTLKK